MLFLFHLQSRTFIGHLRDDEIRLIRMLDTEDMIFGLYIPVLMLHQYILHHRTHWVSRSFEKPSLSMVAHYQLLLISLMLLL